MQVKKREALEKYGISLHSGPVSDPGLGPGGMEALQPWLAASPSLEMSSQPSPLLRFHPSFGLAGTTSPPGRRDARQALGGGRVCPGPGTGGAKVTLTEIEPIKVVLSSNSEFFSLELLRLSVDRSPSRIRGG